MKASIIALLSTLIVGICAAGALAVEHEGAATFTPPAGWTKRMTDSKAQFIASDETGVFAIGSSKVCGSADKEADEVLKSLQTLPEFHQEGDRRSGQHIATRGRWVSFSYSFADQARPGRYNYGWQTLVAAGGRSVAVTAVFKEPEGFNRHTPVLGQMIDSLQITSAIIVEPGDPPLTRFTLEGAQDFVEWLMQSPLTDGQKETVESELRGLWKKNDRAGIEGMGKIMEARDQLAALTPEKRDLAREAILETAVKQWRTGPQDAGTRLLLEIYDCSHKPIADGTPPLTRQSVDAFAELLCFAGAQTAGVTSAVPAEVKTKLAEGVAANYGKLTPDQQQQIASMPLAWAALRAAWPDLRDDQKQQYVDAWKKDATLVQLGTILKGPAPESSATPPASTSSGSPAAAMAQFQEFQKKQMMYQTMSNVMMMRHQMMNTIISNTGGNTRYEYRWR